MIKPFKNDVIKISQSNTERALRHTERALRHTDSKTSLSHCKLQWN